MGARIPDDGQLANFDKVILLADGNRAPIEVIDKPEIVQRYIDEGFLAYGDGREAFFDPVRFVFILVG